jgi:hypothetical protein
LRNVAVILFHLIVKEGNHSGGLRNQGLIQPGYERAR